MLGLHARQASGLEGDRVLNMKSQIFGVRPRTAELVLLYSSEPGRIVRCSKKIDAAARKMDAAAVGEHMQVGLISEE
jgi:hypothetical protein